MGPVPASRRLLAAIAVAVVVFAFWPALIGGGSLVSHDIVATAPPFDSYRPDEFSLENGPGDPINIHAHWAALADDVRRGDLSWWNPDLAAGQPTFKGGLPVFDLPYLVSPSWYAPGLVAAIRALTAIVLGVGFLRSVGLGRAGALTGAIAFAFSGFMVGWMNWPHSSVAALAPGLLWAIERVLRDPRPWRAVPLGAVLAAMVWANFPSVLIYVLVGAAVYAVVRVIVELVGAGGTSLASRPHAWLGPRLLVGVGAAAIAAFLAWPHLVGFSEYVDWADTSHRVGNPDDSSAGAAYLLTALAPAVWGSDAVGPGWFGEGNWVEFNTHVGTSVVVLAVVGICAGVLSSDARRRSVAIGLGLVVLVGVVVAYVGGPIGVAIGDLTGSRGGLMTRAKVLIGLGAALGAGLGVDWLAGAASDRRRVLRLVGVVTAVAIIGLAPAMTSWFDAARAHGTTRDAIAASTMAVLAGAATMTLIVARLRGRLRGGLVGRALAVVVIVELLAFAMPVPTIVSRAERLRATPAHEAVLNALGPGERLAGEGRTFFPATTQHFDIPDARGQLLKSPGYQALLRAVDPAMLRRDGGGTPTYPNIAVGTDISSPVWDAMAVGVWAQFPDSQPPGTVTPPQVVDGADPAVQPLHGSTVVPPGGLRAVLVDLGPTVGGFVDVVITTIDGTTEERRWLDPVDAGSVSFAVLGEHLPVGSAVDVVVRAPRPTLLAGVDHDGRLGVGTIAGDDDLELIRTGDVILVQRPVEAVRVAHAVHVEPDPVAAAALVADGPGPATAVVDRDVGLAASAPESATATLGAVDYGRGVIRVEITTGAPALVVVAEAHYPGWRASVDGHDAELVVADAAFMGVVVPEGTHRVELTFTPRHLTLSVVSLVVGVVLAVAALAHGLRRGDLRLPGSRRG